MITRISMIIALTSLSSSSSSKSSSSSYRPNSSSSRSHPCLRDESNRCKEREKAPYEHVTIAVLLLACVLMTVLRQKHIEKKNRGLKPIIPKNLIYIPKKTTEIKASVKEQRVNNLEKKSLKKYRSKSNKKSYY